MKAIMLNRTLKAPPEPPNTDQLASIVIDELSHRGVDCETVCVVDHNILPGVQVDMAQAVEGRRCSVPVARGAAASLVTVLKRSPQSQSQSLQPNRAARHKPTAVSARVVAEALSESFCPVSGSSRS